MTQEDFDFANGICTLSKILFFKTAKGLGLSTEKMLILIRDSKHLSSTDCNNYLYYKASKYKKKSYTTKKDFIKYLLK